VETASEKIIETGQNIFEWIWDGLPPAERVIFAAIASATDEHSVVTEGQLMPLKQVAVVRQSDYGSFSLKRLFDLLSREDRHIIVLIDEFEVLLHHRNFNTAEF